MWSSRAVGVGEGYLGLEGKKWLCFIDINVWQVKMSRVCCRLKERLSLGWSDVERTSWSRPLGPVRTYC